MFFTNQSFLRDVEGVGRSVDVSVVAHVQRDNLTFSETLIADVNGKRPADVITNYVRRRNVTRIVAVGHVAGNSRDVTDQIALLSLKREKALFWPVLINISYSKQSLKPCEMQWVCFTILLILFSSLKYDILLFLREEKMKQTLKMYGVYIYIFFIKSSI